MITQLWFEGVVSIEDLSECVQKGCCDSNCNHFDWNKKPHLLNCILWIDITVADCCEDSPNEVQRVYVDTIRITRQRTKCVFIVKNPWVWLTIINWEPTNLDPDASQKVWNKDNGQNDVDHVDNDLVCPLIKLAKLVDPIVLWGFTLIQSDNVKKSNQVGGAIFIVLESSKVE